MQNFLAQLIQALGPHAGLYIGAAVLVGGLVYGFRDVSRFAFRRVWAISGVCFDESIRRRVLWIIPLAIVGLIIVVQLQQPLDEQDAIRETSKFCLFATGLVVITSTIILASTSLPREIENRVIFTIVTKPTTRLEIVLGKIVGFAKVSLTILCIMGLFTFGYLHFRAWSLERDLNDRLKANVVEAVSRPTFQHYVDAGLLNAKNLATPVGMNLYGRVPDAGSMKRYSQPEGYIYLPFELPADSWAVADPENAQHAGPGMVIKVRVGYDPAAKPPTPAGAAATQPVAVAPGLQICDPSAASVLYQEIKPAQTTLEPDGSVVLTATVASNYTALLKKYRYFYVSLVTPPNAPGPMWVIDDPAKPPAEILFPVTTSPEPRLSLPLPALPGSPSKTATAFAGREGVSGQQLKGDPTARSQACVYQYRGVKLGYGPRDRVPLEFKVGVEKNGEAAEEEATTATTLQVINAKTGEDSGIVQLAAENNRTMFASVPMASMEGGDFDVVVRCLTAGQWINVRPRSLLVVQSESLFGLNLAKSLTIIWLLSILVTTISVFCSTFLSWPIAVVLTLVILFGRWGVNELGDAASAGIGRQFVSDFGVRDPSVSQAVSDTVEKLNTALKTFASVLPDVSQFSATDDIERGLSIPVQTLVDALEVLAAFGLPLSVLAYVFLKNKEVAP